MDRAGRGIGAARGWAGPLASRAAALASALWGRRGLLRARDQPLSGLTDRQLRDIGLSRHDVARPHERSQSPELDTYRMLRGRD